MNKLIIYLIILFAVASIVAPVYASPPPFEEGTSWGEMFQSLTYGNGAFFGLSIIAVLGVIASVKIRAMGVVFMVICGMLCLKVITYAGTLETPASVTANSTIYAALGYALLIVLFLFITLKGKGSAL